MSLWLFWGVLGAPAELLAQYQRLRHRFRDKRANIDVFTVQQRTTPAIVNSFARSYADKATPTEVSSILEQRIRGVQEEAGLAETGRVLSVG
jgi:hypothetical protein